MRYLVISCVTGLLALTSLDASERPLGMIASMEEFELQGVRIPAGGLGAWPVVAGDEVTTKTSEAALLLEDRTEMVLEPDSRIMLRRGGQRIAVELLKGGLEYKFAQGSPVDVFALGEKVVLSASQGRVSLGSNDVFVNSFGSSHDFFPSFGHLHPPQDRSPADCRNPFPGTTGGRSPCAPHPFAAILFRILFRFF